MVVNERFETLRFDWQLLLDVIAPVLSTATLLCIINIKNWLFSKTNFTKGFTKELLSVCKGYRSKIN